MEHVTQSHNSLLGFKLQLYTTNILNFPGERIAIQGLQPETLSSLGAGGTQGKYHNVRYNRSNKIC